MVTIKKIKLKKDNIGDIEILNLLPRKKKRKFQKMKIMQKKTLIIKYRQNIGDIEEKNKVFFMIDD